MTEPTEKPSIPYEKSTTAGLRKLMVVVAAFFVIWLVFGQVMPRIMMDSGPATVRQELNMNPQGTATASGGGISLQGESLQARRQSYREQLEAKEKELDAMRETVTQLDNRVKALEQKSGTAATTQAPNSDDTKAQAQAAATAAAQTALAQAQTAYGEKLDGVTQKITGYNDKLTTIQNQLVALQSHANDADQQRSRMTTIETALHQQHELIEAVKTEIAGAQIQTVRQLSALASFMPLKEAVERGEAFDTPLTQMLNFTHGNRQVEELAGQLAPIAKQGTPSLPALRTEFQALLMKALATGGKSNTLSSNLSSLISIRKTGEQPGNTDEAIFARAENRLNQSDMDACIKELDQLSEGASKVMAPWVEKAKRYELIHKLMTNMQLALTQEIPAVQTSLPDQPALDAAPGKARTLPATVANNPPAAATEDESAKPVPLQPSAPEPVKTEAKKAPAKPAVKPAAKQVEKPKPTEHKESKKPSHDDTSDSDAADKSESHAPAQTTPATSGTKAAYPGN